MCDRRKVPKILEFRIALAVEFIRSIGRAKEEDIHYIA